MKITNISKRLSNWKARIHDRLVMDPQYLAKLRSIAPFRPENEEARQQLEQLWAERAARLAELHGHSARLIHRRDRYGENLLVRVVTSGNCPALVRFIGNGANMNLRYNTQGYSPVSNYSLLHYAACQSNADAYRAVAQASTYCSSCVRDATKLAPIHLGHSRIEILKVLVYEFNVRVAVFDENGASPLHLIAMFATSSFRGYGLNSPLEDCARLLLECDYERAMSGCDFDATSTMQLLTTRNSDGRTPRETACKGKVRVKKNKKLISLLAGWETSSLTVPPPGCHDSTASLLLNPELTRFQRFLARNVLGVLDASPIHEVSSQVLGFLTPVDVLVNWNQWLGVNSSHTLCQCCST